MADGPWQCSTCGTINEPVANSCRTCGKWPSLFDLQDSIVDEVELEDAREPAPAARFPAQPPPFEPETFETDPVAPEPFEPDGDLDEEPEPEGSSRRKLLTSFIVPIGFVVFIVIQIIFGER